MTMQHLKSSRVKISETIHSLRIEIPVKRNLFVLGFLTFWLCGWLAGELFALSIVSGTLFIDATGAEWFILFWLFAWTIAGFFVIKIWLSMLIGKEIITFDRGELCVRSRFNFFNKTTVFSLKHISNFGLNNTKKLMVRQFDNRTLNLKSSSGFSFTCNNQQEDMAHNLSQEEAVSVFNTIKERHFLKENQFKKND